MATRTGGEAAAMVAGNGIQLLHERVLIDRARRGDVAAFDELYRRNAHPVWRFGLAVSLSPDTAAAGLIAAFGGGWVSPPTSPIDRPARASLLAAARRHALAHGEVAMPGLAHLERSAAPAVVQIAFAELPEPWRAALWLRDAEQLPVAEVSQVLDVPVEHVDLLADRATAGFVQRVIATRAAGALDRDCRRATDRLGAYAAALLPARDAHRVRRHLEGCERCRRFFADLSDLTPALRALATPLPEPLAAAARFGWQSALVPVSGPLRLTLPGGRPVPAWAERSVAGAAAAVIALGIVGASVLIGRGSRVRDDGLSRQTAAEQPYGLDDGESALAIPGFDDLLLPPGHALPRDGAGPAGDGAAPPAALPAETPRASDSGGVSGSGGSGSSSGSTGSGPGAGSGGGTGAGGSGTTTTTAPAPSTTEEPALQVTGGIDGVIEVGVGDACTGVSVAGTTLGCEPTGGTGLETGGSLLP